jgi:hypothetical protein
MKISLFELLFENKESEDSVQEADVEMDKESNVLDSENEEVEDLTESAFLDENGEHVCAACLLETMTEETRIELNEAEYRGRKVPLGKPMQGDVKKFKVYVKDPKTGNVKKVNFGDPNMRIKKSNPKRRKSFRARHKCSNPGPRTKARYWSCRAW